jgi:hypothetical protein
MGRFVHAQETCIHMMDFRNSTAQVFRHAMWRGYPQRLVKSVWSRFLSQRWHSSDIRVKELRAWFPKVWKYISSTGKAAPEPMVPRKPISEIHAEDHPAYMEAFGLPRHPGSNDNEEGSISARSSRQSDQGANGVEVPVVDCIQCDDAEDDESVVHTSPVSPGPFLSSALVTLFGRISDETREEPSDPGMHNLEYLCGLFTPSEDLPQSPLCTRYRPALRWNCAPEPPTMSQSSQTDVEAPNLVDQGAATEDTLSHEDAQRQPPVNAPIALHARHSSTASQQESHTPDLSLASEVAKATLISLTALQSQNLHIMGQLLHERYQDSRSNQTTYIERPVIIDRPQAQERLYPPPTPLVPLERTHTIERWMPVPVPICTPTPVFLPGPLQPLQITLAPTLAIENAPQLMLIAPPVQNPPGAQQEEVTSSHVIQAIRERMELSDDTSPGAKRDREQADTHHIPRTDASPEDSAPTKKPRQEEDAHADAAAEEGRMLPSRARQKPDRYQSQQVEAAEKEQRRRALLLADKERTSHNWKEGARMGEAEHPGPSNSSLAWRPNTQWWSCPKLQAPHNPCTWQNPSHSRMTNHPGAMSQGSVRDIFRRQPGGMAHGQRRKHLQGSLQRGLTSAPNPPAPMRGLFSVATPVVYESHPMIHHFTSRAGTAQHNPFHASNIKSPKAWAEWRPSEGRGTQPPTYLEALRLPNIQESPPLRTRRQCTSHHRYEPQQEHSGGSGTRGPHYSHG